MRKIKVKPKSCFFHYETKNDVKEAIIDLDYVTNINSSKNRGIQVYLTSGAYFTITKKEYTEKVAPYLLLPDTLSFGRDYIIEIMAKAIFSVISALDEARVPTESESEIFEVVWEDVKKPERKILKLMVQELIDLVLGRGREVEEGKLYTVADSEVERIIIGYLMEISDFQGGSVYEEAYNYKIASVIRRAFFTFFNQFKMYNIL